MSRLFADPRRLWSALSHNLIWIVLGTVTPVAIGLFLGVLLWRGVRGMVFFRTVYFLPVVLAPVAVGIIWKWMYNPQFGPINSTLRAVGLDVLAKGWLGDPYLALPAIILAGVWGYFGFCFVVIMAGLQNIDMEQIDAALVDGANGPQSAVVYHHSRFAACAHDDHRLYTHPGCQRLRHNLDHHPRRSWPRDSRHRHLYL